MQRKAGGKEDGAALDPSSPEGFKSLMELRYMQESPVFSILFVFLLQKYSILLRFCSKA